jgi:glycosyl transferase family 25
MGDRNQTVRAYVINLVRSPERRENITAQLIKHGIEYEIIEGVDGRELDLTDSRVTLDISSSFLAADSFRPGLAGCALSHLRVYRKILDDGRDQALVLEDDVTIPADLSGLADAVAKQLVGAEVALLNFDSPQACRVSRRDAVALPSSRQLVLPIDLSQPVSGAAYVITREACERMNERALPVRVKADSWAHFYNEGIIDRLRCVVPLAVTKDPRFGSTMGYYSDASLKARILTVITRHNVRVFERIVARRRERIWRRYTQVEFVDEQPT